MPNISLCRPDELGPSELDRWRDLQRADPSQASPFLAPEFAIVIGRHRPDVRVAVITDGPDIVSFFPHHRQPFGIGRGVGCGLANVEGIVHADGYAWDPRELLRRCGLAVWEFDNLLGVQADSFRPRHAAPAPAPFIDLSPGWDAWLAGKRASSVVKAALRKQRKLSREVGEVTFEFDSTRRDALDLLKKWKSHQYRRTGRPDLFTRPWVAAVFDELTMMKTPQFGGTLSVLAVDGRPIAVQQGLRAGHVLSYWFPAYDVDMAPYSPGMISVLEMVQGAAEAGITDFDLGKGPADYKETLKDGDKYVVTGWTERPSPVAALRRLQQSPQRHLADFVLSRPRLRRAVRRARNNIGRVRTALRTG